MSASSTEVSGICTRGSAVNFYWSFQMSAHIRTKRIIRNRFIIETPLSCFGCRLYNIIHESPMTRWSTNCSYSHPHFLLCRGSGDDSGPGRLSRRLSRLGSRHQSRDPPRPPAQPERPPAPPDRPVPQGVCSLALCGFKFPSDTRKTRNLHLLMSMQPQIKWI